MMSEWLFLGLMGFGALVLAAGLIFGNTAPKTRHESCGCTGLMIVIGLLLVIAPPAAVFFQLLAYYW